MNVGNFQIISNRIAVPCCQDTDRQSTTVPAGRHALTKHGQIVISGWQWQTAAQIASNSERRGSYHHRNKEVRVDEASSTRTSLATYQATDHL